MVICYASLQRPPRPFRQPIAGRTSHPGTIHAVAPPYSRAGRRRSRKTVSVSLLAATRFRRASGRAGCAAVTQAGDVFFRQTAALVWAENVTEKLGRRTGFSDEGLYRVQAQPALFQKRGNVLPPSRQATRIVVEQGESSR